VEYSIIESEYYLDKYLTLLLRCPNVINLIDPSALNTDLVVANELYWSSPTVSLMQATGDVPFDYWLAPSRPNNIGNWLFEFEAGSDAERKLWANYGMGIVQLEWEDINDSIATTELTIIVKDNETSEMHYVDLTVSVSYHLIAEASDLGEIETGLGPARCSADLTFVRSYP
jgi:hypothetical protein